MQEGTTANQAMTNDEHCHTENDDDSRVSEVVRSLAFIATSKGEGTEQLLAPLREARALTHLRALIADTSSSARGLSESVLHCLAQLGRHMDVWPEIDASLAKDLERLLVLGVSAATAEFLKALLAESARIVALGDLRPLRNAVRGNNSDNIKDAARLLQSTKCCCQCGQASTTPLLVCGGCRKEEYCSRDCQKTAWKVHKTKCSSKSK